MRKKRKRKTLLNRNRLGQVARLIDFAPQQIGNMISQKLQRQIRAIEEEECVFEADYDIRVCEKWG